MSLTIRRVATAALCLAAGTVVLAPPAHAAPGVTGKVTVSGSSAYGDEPVKSAKAYCPAGKVVISGGGWAQGASYAELTLLRPVTSGNYFEASARSYSGRPLWKLFAYAVCANPPPGLAYLSWNSTTAPGADRTAKASCPAGRRVIGLGARVAAEPGRNVALATMMPLNGISAFVRTTMREGGEPDDWTTTAYVVCASVSTTVVTATSPVDSVTLKLVSVDCTPGWLAAIGGVIPANGQVSFEWVYPQDELDGGWVRAREDQTGYNPTWSVQAYAICA